MPRLAVKPAPLTLRSLMRTTVSPALKREPLLSMCLMSSASSELSTMPACAQLKVSSSRYIISKRSFAQLSDFRWLSMRHETTCTAGTWLHMQSFKQCQWFVSAFAGVSICAEHMLQARALFSSEPSVFGVISITDRFSVMPQNSHFDSARAVKSFNKFMFLVLHKLDHLLSVFVADLIL